MTKEAPAAEPGEEVEKPKPDDKKPKETEKNGDDKDKGKGVENHEPTVNSPRWKEVYNKWKHSEAKAEELEKDMDAVRSHARNLEARVLELADKKADRSEGPKPDPAVDPEAYAKWVDLQYERKQQAVEKERAIQRLEDKRDVAEGLFDDYPDVVKTAERDMERDPELKKKIWSQSNPFIAAYKYAKNKKDDADKKDAAEKEKELNRETNKGKGHVEGGGEPPPEEGEEPEITDDEKRVIRNLFPGIPAAEATKKYLDNRNKMFRR